MSGARDSTDEVLEATREAMVRINGADTSDAATLYGLDGNEVCKYALQTFSDPKAAGYFVTGLLVGLTLAMREQERQAA